MRQSEQSQNDTSVYITMLGGFSVRVGENEIQDSSARTHQLWHLIEYLIAYRHRTVTQEELIQVLWPEGNIDNPANALKNLVYRVRTTLSSNGLAYAREMIVYSRGSYRWNNNLVTVVDTEEFEEQYKMAMTSGQTVENQVRRYCDTIDLYSGDFLPGARFETWVVSLSSHYRWMYFNCVYAVLEILEEQQRYAEMEQICRKAVGIDQFEEAAHRYLIFALMRQGKQAQALAHYSAVTDLFFRELGINPSSSMRALYREIVKATHDVEIDLSIIKEDLEESEWSKGAFYCEYEVFKNLYRLEARAAARTGQSIFVALATVEDSAGNVLEVKLQNKVMDSLYGIIQTNLRLGDVFARFSASQYVLMLPSLTFENCDMVMDRIIKRFRQVHRNKNVSIYSKIQPLDPIELIKG